RRKIGAASVIPGVARRPFSSDAGSSERVRSEAPCWKTPKSARPTWIRSAAVARTPAAIDSSATISATPIATPAAVGGVCTDRRMGFGQTGPGQVMPLDFHAFVPLRAQVRRAAGGTVPAGGGWRGAAPPLEGWGTEWPWPLGPWPFVTGHGAPD